MSTLNYWMNSCIRHMDGKVWSEHDLIEIERKLSGKHKVMRLSEQEAKALISDEYGFEYSSIKIEGDCWYEATDMNYFRFSVKGWQYEAEDYGAPKIL